jgi:peptide subunit release factor RF-3
MIHAAGPELRFPPIPSFSPELFSYMRCAPNQKKAFAKGVEGLLGEGAVQASLCAVCVATLLPVSKVLRLLACT